eukprot:gene9584-biopygen4718
MWGATGAHVLGKWSESGRRVGLCEGRLDGILVAGRGLAVCLKVGREWVESRATARQFHARGAHVGRHGGATWQDDGSVLANPWERCGCAVGRPMGNGRGAFKQHPELLCFGGVPRWHRI